MLTATQHSQREWLNARCHILELAAVLDRMDQAGGPAAAQDPVYRKIQELLHIVQRPEPMAGRATAILNALSTPV
jgi:hypothetical protein